MRASVNSGRLQERIDKAFRMAQAPDDHDRRAGFARANTRTPRQRGADLDELRACSISGGNGEESTRKCLDGLHGIAVDRGVHGRLMVLFRVA